MSWQTYLYFDGGTSEMKKFSISRRLFEKTLYTYRGVGPDGGIEVKNPFHIIPYLEKVFLPKPSPLKIRDGRVWGALQSGGDDYSGPTWSRP